MLNVNLFTTVTTNKLNEFHFTFSREDRPRLTSSSSIPADTAMGFATTFRFGNPFFLAPSIDELIKRFQLKDNFSIVSGRHTMKAGGEWLHANNAQVFRGFFEGRYIFDSVTGFLRYAAPAAPGGFGPYTVGCSNGRYVTAPASCPSGSTSTGGPLSCFTYKAAARTASHATRREPRTSTTRSSRCSSRISWQMGHGLTLDYGLRWDAQLMPATVDPKTTAYAFLLNDPRFPSDGKIPNQAKEIQPRVGVAWDMRQDAKSVLRASAVCSMRGRKHAEPGRVGHDQRYSAEERLSRLDVYRIRRPARLGRNLLAPSAVPAGTFPLFTGVKVFDRDYQNPRIYSFNAGFERELATNVSAYVDLTVAKSVHLTRFLNYNVHGTAAAPTQQPRATQRPTSGRIHSDRNWATCSSPTASGTACTARHVWCAKAAVAVLPAGSELRPVKGRRRRFERARSVHRSVVQLLRPEP